MILRKLASCSLFHAAKRSLSSSSLDTIALHKHLHGQGVFTLRMENEKKKNAITFEAMRQAGDHFRTAANDTNCKVLIWTGLGDTFSSGLDLMDSARTYSLYETPEKAAKEMGHNIFHFITGLIDFPKPIIAAVNGPAIGIGVTVLPLCDLVVADAERATFNTPFSSLGFVIEACSSYTFPLLLGPQLANDVLLFGRVLTAKEANDVGFVNRLLPSTGNFEAEYSKFAREVATFPPNFYQAAKRLLRRDHREKLYKVCREEIDAIAVRSQSKEVADAFMAFMSRKQKKLS